MTKKKTIILSVIAVILISAAVFLFVSPVTVTCSRTVRFYLCGVDGYRALMEMEDGERLEGKFEYIDMSADITVCKSIFRLDTSGGLIINDIHHTIGIYEDDFGYGNAGFTDFRPSRMHSHLAKISNGTRSTSSPAGTCSGSIAGFCRPCRPRPCLPAQGTSRLKWPGGAMSASRWRWSTPRLPP